MADAAIAFAVEKSAIPVAEEEVDEETVRARIVDHVNQYHRRELQLYIQHYASDPPPSTSTSTSTPQPPPGTTISVGPRPTLLDITSAGMTIDRNTRTAAGRDTAPAFVPFDPPLADLGHARARLVAMALEARAALGLGAFDVYEFRAPRGKDWLPFAGVLLYYACVVARPWVVPGSKGWEVLDVVWRPFGGASGWRWLVGAIFWPVVGIHVIEVAWLDKTRLRRFGIQSNMLVWWLWCATCFVEGLTAFTRFDDMVEDIRALIEGRDRHAKKND